ncbi:MAG: nitroreductase family protein [Acidobacteriota bacterium]
MSENPPGEASPPPSADAQTLYDSMSTLRAVRRLRPDPIPEAVLQRVLQAAVWAPSGGNVQPWRVVVVRDAERKTGLRDLYRPEWQKYAKGYAARLEGLDAKERGKQERTLAAGDRLADRLDQAPAILIFCFNPKLMAITDAGLDRPSIVGGGSVYPAIQNCLLACRAEGLGCTLTTLLCLKEGEVKKLLGIPDDWYTCAAVPIGYPELGGHGPIHRRPVSTMAFEDTWGEAWNGESE